MMEGFEARVLYLAVDPWLSLSNGGTCICLHLTYSISFSYLVLHRDAHLGFSSGFFFLVLIFSCDGRDA